MFLPVPEVGQSEDRSHFPKALSEVTGSEQAHVSRGDRTATNKLRSPGENTKAIRSASL